VLLSTGLHRNPLCLGFIAALRGKGLPFVSAISQEAFIPPSDGWTKLLRSNGAFTVEQREAFSAVAQGQSTSFAADALQELYKALAWRFTPQVQGVELRRDFDCIVQRGIHEAARSAADGSKQRGDKSNVAVPGGKKFIDEIYGPSNNTCV